MLTAGQRECLDHVDPLQVRPNPVHLGPFSISQRHLRGIQKAQGRRALLPPKPAPEFPFKAA